MPICNKCFIDKPQDDYYREFRWGKFYYKKYCLDCSRKQAREYKLKKDKLIELPKEEKITQPVVLELEPEVFTTPVNSKECFSCEEIKPVTEFYISPRGTIFKNCKACHVKHYREKVVENNKDKGGSERVSYYPNTYVDDYQKEQTFWVMELMGWTYNDNGVWSKEGIKDKDKVWVNVVEKKKRKKHPNCGNGGRKILSVHSKVDEVIRDYKNGNDFFDLADIYNCSHTTIRKLIKDYYNGQTTN